MWLVVVSKSLAGGRKSWSRSSGSQGDCVFIASLTVIHIYVYKRVDECVWCDRFISLVND